MEPLPRHLRELVEPPERVVVAGGGRPELLIRIPVAAIVRSNGATVADIVAG